MSIDKYLHRIANPKRYNCAHFACEVWRDLTGHDLSPHLQGVLTHRADREAIKSDLKVFRRLDKPVSPCIVMMFSNARRSETHIGIYLRGRILHIIREGVFFQRLEQLKLTFDTIRYYQCH